MSFSAPPQNQINPQVQIQQRRKGQDPGQDEATVQGWSKRLVLGCGDPTPWLPLVVGASSRNLRHSLTIPVLKDGGEDWFIAKLGENNPVTGKVKLWKLGCRLEYAVD